MMMLRKIDRPGEEGVPLMSGEVSILPLLASWFDVRCCDAPFDQNPRQFYMLQVLTMDEIKGTTGSHECRPFVGEH